MLVASQIRLLEQDIWTVESSHKFLGIDFGGRMTVIRLSSGDLFLHSPVLLNKNLANELDGIGVVKYLVAPNKFHHVHIGEYLSVYPDAEVWAAPGLLKKRKDINFHGELGVTNPLKWGEEIECVLFEGVPFLNEVVFYHTESRTILFSDLIFNFSDDENIVVKIFAWLDGVYGRPDVNRLIRWFMIRDREKARDSVQKILSWDFDRVSITHRDIIETGGKVIVSRAFESI
jgi:hypothetical protein